MKVKYKYNTKAYYQFGPYLFWIKIELKTYWTDFYYIWKQIKEKRFVCLNEEIYKSKYVYDNFEFHHSFPVFLREQQMFPEDGFYLRNWADLEKGRGCRD